VTIEKCVAKFSSRTKLVVQSSFDKRMKRTAAAIFMQFAEEKNFSADTKN